MLLTRGAILVGNKTDLERHREVTRQGITFGGFFFAVRFLSNFNFNQLDATWPKRWPASSSRHPAAWTTMSTNFWSESLPRSNSIRCASTALPTSRNSCSALRQSRSTAKWIGSRRALPPLPRSSMRIPFSGGTPPMSPTAVHHRCPRTANMSCSVSNTIRKLVRTTIKCLTMMRTTRTMMMRNRICIKRPPELDNSSNELWVIRQSAAPPRRTVVAAVVMVVAKNRAQPPRAAPPRRYRCEPNIC